MNAKPVLSLEQVVKCFGETRALDGVSFEVGEGEIVAVVGPSGCGKSTLLGVVAGLERPDAGTVCWQGRDLAGMPPHLRGFGLMFQDYALFPHLDVFENVAFGLRMAGQGREAVRYRVEEMLALVGLAGFGERGVGNLSGGEQQRVALARALAPAPRLSMLDEPLGALDRALRERLLVELAEILRGLRQTALVVTHDQEEAFALADRVVVMEAGRVLQVATPEALFARPASARVARFLGFRNLLPGRLRKAAHGWEVVTQVGAFAVEGAGAGEGPVVALLRPEAMRVAAEGEAAALVGEVVARAFRGTAVRLGVVVEGVALAFELPAEDGLPGVGDRVRLMWGTPRGVQVFGAEEI